MRLENVISSYVLEHGIERAWGHVHSVFATSFNVKLGGFLFHVGDSRSPLSCCGINLAPDALESFLCRVRVGDRATIKQGVLIVYDSAQLSSIDLSALEARSLAIVPSASACQLRELEKEISKLCVEEKIGLDRDVRFREMVQLLEQQNPHEYELRTAISFFLGRGLGLTPAGDDLLVGYGISLWLQGRVREFVQVLLDMLVRQTTDVSESYLRAMAAGYASQGYCELIAAVSAGETACLSRMLANLQRIGHTSGNDGLFGFLIGLRSAV